MNPSSSTDSHLQSSNKIAPKDNMDPHRVRVHLNEHLHIHLHSLASSPNMWYHHLSGQVRIQMKNQKRSNRPELRRQSKNSSASIQTLVTTKGKSKREAEEQKTRRWRRPREKTAPLRTKEVARVRGAVPSSFASTEIDHLKNDEKRRKQSGNGIQEPVERRRLFQWELWRSGQEDELRALGGREESAGRHRVGFQIDWQLRHPGVRVGGAPEAQSKEFHRRHGDQSIESEKRKHWNAGTTTVHFTSRLRTPVWRGAAALPPDPR